VCAARWWRIMVSSGCSGLALCDHAVPLVMWRCGLAGRFDSLSLLGRCWWWCGRPASWSRSVWPAVAGVSFSRGLGQPQPSPVFLQQEVRPRWVALVVVLPDTSQCRWRSPARPCPELAAFGAGPTPGCGISACHRVALAMRSRSPGSQRAHDPAVGGMVDWPGRNFPINGSLNLAPAFQRLWTPRGAGLGLSSLCWLAVRLLATVAFGCAA